MYQGILGDEDKLVKEIDTLYKILHQSNFSTALQTLKLLYHLLTSRFFFLHFDSFFISPAYFNSIVWSNKCIFFKIQVIFTNSEGISDRFYAALYRRILDLQHGTNVDRQLFSLLYRALSSDTVEYRVIAFIKRLLQVCVVMWKIWQVLYFCIFV